MSSKLKNVYFVRHAESIGNANDVHQGPDTPLSESGLLQTSFIAERFGSIPIEGIISSDMLRAEKTAYAISEKTGNEVTLSHLFRERKRPTTIFGLPAQSEEAKAIEKAIIDNYNNPDWHYSDEENFFDLRDRARKAIAYLHEREESSLCVVTHGMFLRITIGVMQDSDIPSHEFLRLSRFLIPKNTGITWCQKGHPKAVDPNIWQMVTWNDHAHLG